MKKLFLLVLLSLTGCGQFTTGSGTFDGRLIDVHWGGLLFKSCEATVQLGNQSSTSEKLSSLSPEMCERLTKAIGSVVNITYDAYVGPCCLRTESKDIIKDFKLGK